MPIEHETRDGALVWIRNPITGVVSYVVDVRNKSFAFTLGLRDEPVEPPHLTDAQIRAATKDCPFCPGNEHLSTAELFRMSAAEVPEWTGRPAARTTNGSCGCSTTCFPAFLRS